MVLSSCSCFNFSILQSDIVARPKPSQEDLIGRWTVIDWSYIMQGQVLLQKTEHVLTNRSTRGTHRKTWNWRPQRGKITGRVEKGAKAEQKRKFGGTFTFRRKCALSPTHGVAERFKRPRVAPPNYCQVIHSLRKKNLPVAIVTIYS